MSAPALLLGGLSLVGGIIGAVGSIRQAKQQSEIAERNALIAEQEGQARRQAAEFEETRFRREAKRFQARARVIGKNGIQFTGSPLLIVEENAEQAEIDALAIRFEGEIGAARANSQASIDRLQAKSIRTAGAFAAGASLITGATGAARAFATANPQSTFGDS